MRLFKFSIIASLLLASPPLFASLMWKGDQLNTNILNETNTLCKISHVNIKHGLEANSLPTLLIVPHTSTSISLLELLNGNAVDVDLVCGDKKISLSTWQDQGIVLSGTAHGVVLSADNGIRAIHTVESHWGVLGGMADVNWTLLNY